MTNDHGSAVGPGSIDPWLHKASEGHIDPFLIWSVFTRFREFVGRDSTLPGDIDFLVELTDRYDKDIKDAFCRSGLWSPTEYLECMPGAATTSRYITLRLPAKGKEPASIADAVLGLMGHPAIHRIQIGFPRGSSRSDGEPHDSRTKATAAKPRVILGLIDDTCPFGHPALTTGGIATRVQSLWDQSRNDGPQPRPNRPPANMGYGALLPGCRLAELLKKHAYDAKVDDEALYQDDSARQPRLRLRSSHAAAVAGLLGGARSALPTTFQASRPCIGPGDDAPERPSDSPVDDEAARAPLIVVQFPDEELGIALARWMVVRTLDGLRYIARNAAELSGNAETPAPLVVNISYGSIIGGHDGTALLEQAMDELVDAYGEMAIVLAAGNTHGTRRAEDDGDIDIRQPGGRHARHALPAAGGRARLALYLPPDKSIESHLDVWLARPRDVEARFLDENDIEVTLIPPPGTGLSPVTAGCPDLHLVPLGEPVFGLFVLPKAAQSTRQSLVSLTVAATQVCSRRVSAPSGLWTVEIVNKSVHELTLDAWVERDILPGKARRQQVARLVQLEGNDAVTLTDENTFNNIATGSRTFRVGALEARCDAAGYRVSPYSSAAVDAKHGPEFSAIADMSTALPGIRVGGSRGGAVVRMNGTSVAAPQAARWIANQLAKRRKLSAIRQQLADSTQGDARRGRLEV